MLSSPQAIIFDCDGTLLLTSDLHFDAISAAAAAQGAILPRAWYMGMTGLDRTALFTRFVQAHGLTLDLPRLVADSIAQTVARAGMARPNPLVANLARRAAGHLPIAVATNAERLVVTALLRVTGLLPLFDAVVSVDDVAAPKPAPEMFLLAAARLGVPPAGCLVLEDSAQGLAAAAAAGMAALDVRDPPAQDWIAARIAAPAH